MTRIPLLMASGPAASTTWSMAVSAPSSRTRAQAKGRSSGWSFNGVDAHDQVVTTPAGPTSTNSPTSSEVIGSYSVGGTTTCPPGVVAPRIRPSRNPVRKAPMTGPTERV